MRNLSTTDLRIEQLISRKWDIPPVKSRPAKGLLITGANSFLGVHVIHLLQDKWPGPLHLLLRAPSPEKANEKLIRAFAAWELEYNNNRQTRVHVGDVTLRKAGLPAYEYHELIKSTGFVLDLAANSLYRTPYLHYQRLWLPELERMITLCADPQHPKSLHYPIPNLAGFFITDKDFQQLGQDAWHSGYAGFKWVASKTIRNAFKQNLSGAIYDLPLVVGSVEKPGCPAHHPFWEMIAYFIKTGFFTDFLYKIVPVDLLASVIVHNLLADIKGQASSFLHPALTLPINRHSLEYLAAGILNLSYLSPERMYEVSPDKEMYHYLFPEGYYSLMQKVSDIPAKWPGQIELNSLPQTDMLFINTLNNLISSKKINLTRIPGP
ncbi:MAG: hypothetical protein Kow00127_23880 [Bacteroidales bacterium]